MSNFSSCQEVLDTILCRFFNCFGMSKVQTALKFTWFHHWLKIINNFWEWQTRERFIVMVSDSTLTGYQCIILTQSLSKSLHLFIKHRQELTLTTVIHNTFLYHKTQKVITYHRSILRRHWVHPVAIGRLLCNSLMFHFQNDRTHFRAIHICTLQMVLFVLFSRSTMELDDTTVCANTKAPNSQSSDSCTMHPRSILW